MSLIVQSSRSVIIFLFFILLSWILIHMFALLGAFIAFGYPLWWIIFPKQTTCLICKSRKDGEKCPFCRRVVRKEEGIMPKTLVSALLNGLIILLLSFVSIGLVYLESRVVFESGFNPVPRTVSFDIPTQKEHQLGEIFEMRVDVNGLTEPINTVQVDVVYNPDRLEVIDISTKSSFATLFIDREIDNKEGFARISGGLPAPGFFGKKGTFAIFMMRGLKPGIATIKFLPTSMVLANNGRGDNVLTSLEPVSYLIVPRTSSKKDNSQKISLRSGILGESTPSAQMIFYEEESQGSEAGINKKVINEDGSIGLVENVINLLGRFDEFVLTPWGKIL